MEISDTVTTRSVILAILTWPNLKVNTANDTKIAKIATDRLRVKDDKKFPV